MKKDIYEALRSGGLSIAGACAMMGNMEAESSCISIRVQGDLKYPYQFSRDYTNQVDIGNVSRHEFIHDGPNGGGYGLCQWTYSTRKAGLYDLAKNKNVSIGDELIQCEFCLYELSTYPENRELNEFLRTTDDVSKATERICAEFERPQVNNFAYRINAAKGFYNEFAESDLVCNPFPPECSNDSCEIDLDSISNEIAVVLTRVLKRGDLGRDVLLLQFGMIDMGIKYTGKLDGDFGVLTEQAVKELQTKNGIDPNGEVAGREWGIILRAR